jgi:hypothetical protein
MSTEQLTRTLTDVPSQIDDTLKKGSFSKYIIRDHTTLEVCYSEAREHLPLPAGSLYVMCFYVKEFLFIENQNPFRATES